MTAPADAPAPAAALRGMFTRDFVYLGVSALQVILSTVVTPLLTRRVGASQFGQFALAITVMQILGPVLSFGLPFATQKIFAEHDGDRRARGVLAVCAALCAAGWLAVVLAAPAWTPAVGLAATTPARLAASWGACFALTSTALAMLRSRENLRAAIVVSTLQSLGAQAAGLALLYLWSPSIDSYLWGVLAGQGVAAITGLIMLRPDWAALGAIRRYGPALLFGLPMVPQQLSVFILFAGDRIVVSHDLGSAATGRYSVAYNVGSLGVLLLVFANQAWTPRIYAMADRAARSWLLATSRDVMSLLLIPVVCGLAAGAPVILRVWAPPSFDPGGLTSIAAIVALSTFPYGQFLSNVRALMSVGRTGRAAGTTLAAAAANIALNVVLVPRFGITGSAVATFVSYVLLAVITRPPAATGLRVPGVPPLLGGILAGACAVTLAMAAAPASPAWLGVRLAVCAGCGLAFALLLRRVITGAGLPGRLVRPLAATAAHRGPPGGRAQPGRHRRLDRPSSARRRRPRTTAPRRAS